MVRHFMFVASIEYVVDDKVSPVTSEDIAKLYGGGEIILLL